MPKPKAKIIEDGIPFDSTEELHFYYWLKEAEENGFIREWTHQAEKFDLIPRQSMNVITESGKTKDKFLFHPVSYTPDFIFVLTDKLKQLLSEKQIYFYVDVKGEYEPTHSKDQVFSIIRKLMYYSKGVYVHKIIPREWFKKTWVPEKAAYMSNRRILTRRKPYINCKLLKEITSEAAA